MMNKKGAEMTIGTIIIIILAIVVLVVLIYGFTSGWGNLWDRLTGFGGGKVNVQNIVDGCKVACSTSSAFDYCQKVRSVVLEEKKPAVQRKCIELQGQYGLEACPTIDCTGVNMNAGTCEALSGRWNMTECVSARGQEDITRQVTNDAGKGDNKFCCKSTCTRIPGAAWSDKVCDDRSKNIYDDLSDKVSDNPNGYRNCCVAK